MIVLENHDYDQIVGNAELTYLNGLYRRFGVATDYQAISHPSLPNYLALVSGQTFGVQVDCTDCIFQARTVVDQLEAAHRSWKAYMDAMPEPCTLQDAGDYYVDHNPFVYFRSVRDNQARCSAHVVPFEDFAGDLQSGKLPNFAWITPDACHDMHSCAPQVADTWLSDLVPQILESKAWRNHGLLVITFDEGVSGPEGGQVATMLASPDFQPGNHLDQPLDHYSLLATIEDLFGLPRLGKAAGARSLAPAFR